jgi:NADH-quinone oxidoreductase subunit L
MTSADQPDALQTLRPDIYKLLENKFWIDELYEKTIIAFNAWWAKVCDLIDMWLSVLVHLLGYLIVGVSWVNRVCDEKLVNRGFDEGCRRVTLGGKIMSRLQSGRVQSYLRVIGVALAVLAVFLIWGGGR